MKKVTILQSRRRPEIIAAEEGEYRRAIGELAEIAFISTLDESLSWNEPASIIGSADAIIIGGSGEFDLDGGREADDPARLTAHTILERLNPLIVNLIDTDFPTLGVCFGHQLIGETMGGSVINDHQQKKVGSYEAHLTEEGIRDPLLGILPSTFMAQYGHKDSLTELPKGSVLLASSFVCNFSALCYGNHAYTMQFHPELTADDVIKKLNSSPGYLPTGVIPESLVKESPETHKLIATFLTEIV